MKNYIAIVLIIVLALTATACNNDKDVLSQIYEVGSSSLSGTVNDSLNHANVISNEIIETQEFPEGTTVSYQTGTEEYTLIYDLTRYYPYRDMTVHRYKINGYGNSAIVLKEDGSIFTISGDMLRVLDVEEYASAEAVRALMETALGDLLDFSAYEHIEVENYPASDGFGQYEFLYYNMVQGYYTNMAIVAVSDNGNIGSIVIESFNYDTSGIGVIDKERENELIQKKLKSICGTNVVEYRDYELRSLPRFRVYENELYIYYSLDCNVYDLKRGKETSFISKLLIPVSVLTES